MVTGLTALACALCAVVAAPAAAQTATTELSAGYQLTRPPISTCRSAGTWTWLVTWRPCLRSWARCLAWYKSETISAGTSSVDATVNLHTFMGGVRVAARTNPKLVPFGQVLFGAARVSGGVTASGPAVSVIAATDADTRFALQIGGGLNLMTQETSACGSASTIDGFLSAMAARTSSACVAGVVIPIGNYRHSRQPKLGGHDTPISPAELYRYSS